MTLLLLMVRQTMWLILILALPFFWWPATIVGQVAMGIVWVFAFAVQIIYMVVTWYKWKATTKVTLDEPIDVKLL